jgi:hypothetical protein
MRRASDPRFSSTSHVKQHARSPSEAFWRTKRRPGMSNSSKKAPTAAFPTNGSAKLKSS